MVALREIMTSDVATVAPEMSVADAAEAMVRGRFGSVAVVVGGTLFGIFTERDVLRAAAGRGDLSTEPVQNWMTSDPVTAPADEDSEDAAVTMLAGGFRHLPVVDDTGGLVGIVSLRDLLGARVRQR
jgi:CBS domain-containing protein